MRFVDMCKIFLRITAPYENYTFHKFIQSFQIKEFRNDKLKFQSTN